MSADGTETAGEYGHDEPIGGAGAASGGEPTEEELRAAYEAELSRLTTTDMMAQAAVSLLNIGARRLAPPSDDPTRPPERDLEQARDAIDAVRALLDILERRIPQELRPLRDALSRLQMAYAQEIGSTSTQPSTPQPAQSPAQPGPSTAPGEQPVPGGAGSHGGPSTPPQGQDPAAPNDQPPGPGPAESSGRLWVPGR
ncbi:MAG TPA: hypothetical protein VGX72_14640 [Solirubrobacteraceae bacterium]|nr:hypothetical protein [Solirubrobacteraceae bacterium]